MANDDVNDELYEDIDFLEQPGEVSTGRSAAALPWVAAGAVVGLGLLFLIDPRHGERNRTTVRDGCSKLGQKCKDTVGTHARTWTERWLGGGADFQAEIRANAPPYLQ